MALWNSCNIDILWSLKSCDSFLRRKFENRAPTCCRLGPTLSSSTISFELQAKMVEEIDLEKCNFPNFRNPMTLTMTLDQATLQPLCRSTYGRWHPQLKTGRFCCSKILLPVTPCWWQLAYLHQGEDARVLPNGVINTISVPCWLQHTTIQYIYNDNNIYSVSSGTMLRSFCTLLQLLCCCCWRLSKSRRSMNTVLCNAASFFIFSCEPPSETD